MDLASVTATLMSALPLASCALFAASLAAMALTMTSSARAQAPAQAPAAPATQGPAAPAAQPPGRAQPPSPPQPDYSAYPDDVAPAEEGALRRMTLEVNPLGPFIGQWGGAIELLPARHHALILSPYYYATRTGQGPENFFQGVGGEIGYRWYSSPNGPRGFFLGPSLILGAFVAQGAALDASHPAPSPSTFYNLGMALDVGYQAIIADRLVIGLGVGAQSIYVTKTFLDQEWPSSVHTNSRLYPRALLSFGYAFNP